MKITEWIRSIFINKLPEVTLSALDKRTIALRACKRVPQWKLAQEYGVPEELIFKIVSNSKVFSKHKEKRRQRELRRSRRKNTY